MNNKKFEVNLFNAFRLVPISKLEDVDGVFNFENALADTIAMNDALIKAYGVTASPKDLVLIAQNNAAKEVYDLFTNEIFAHVAKLSKAKAMYTPEEARNISDAQYRFHQMMHYFSTYGVEFFSGLNVSHGWLPAEAGVAEELNPVKEDIALKEATVFNVIFDTNKYNEVYRRITSRRNRATEMELALLKEAVSHLSLDEIKSVKVLFKENLGYILDVVLESVAPADRAAVLAQVCTNTGDILKYLTHYLNKNRWSLKNSQKKMFVKALEMYSASNLSANLMLSNEKREHNLVLLNYLDFNTYSRSAEHKDVVADFRDKKIKSWEGKLKSALSNKDYDKALAISKERPGMLVRYTNFLLKSGVSEQAILTALLESSDKLSVQTLVENVSKFSVDNIKENLAAHQASLINISKLLIRQALCNKETEIKDKKVYLDKGMFDLAHSSIEFNSKSQNSDFISSGLAIKYPTENVSCLRTFVYWEDDKDGQRVDIDLHSFFINKQGDSVHVGWNSSHNKDGVLTSGDITHSRPYGCEYIDIDLNDNNVRNLIISFHSFTGQKFASIKNLRVGILPVSSLGLEADKSLYNQKNCLFSHEIANENVYTMGYGYVNIEDGYLKFIGKPVEFSYNSPEQSSFAKYLSKYSALDYLNSLFEAQNVTLVENKEDADVVLKLTKPEADNEISLIDKNWFAD